MAKMAKSASRAGDLERLPASEVKTRGWRGVVRRLRERGPLVVTNHDEPEAVILSIEHYAEMIARADRDSARGESELETLRRRFDERLAALQKPGAGARLRSAMRRGPRLRGKVKAGTTY
jgi:prevent-host-death family protein